MERGTRRISPSCTGGGLLRSIHAAKASKHILRRKGGSFSPFLLRGPWEELPFSSAQKRGESEGKGGNGSSPAAGHIQDTLPHSRTIVLSVQGTYAGGDSGEELSISRSVAAEGVGRGLRAGNAVLLPPPSSFLFPVFCCLDLLHLPCHRLRRDGRGKGKKGGLLRTQEVRR